MGRAAVLDTGAVQIVVCEQHHEPWDLGVFRSVGIVAIPAIALEFLRQEASWGDLLIPSDQGLWLGSENAHEVLGLAYYWLRGWHK